MSELIQLVEHQPSEPLTLSTTERDLLITALPNATISPVPGTTDTYTINPRNTVGIINTGAHTIHIAPKIGIPRALFLITYALNPDDWQNTHVDTANDTLLNEAVAIPFIRHAKNALRRHVLHGYKSHDDTLHGIKGRIRFSDQLRRHQRLTVPIEVTYEEYTPDIPENQLLLAALHRLRNLHRLPTSLQHDINGLIHRLADVTHIRYHPRQLPRITINRLNQRYAPALTLAELILTNNTLELGPGNKQSNIDRINDRRAPTTELFDDSHPRLRRRLPLLPFLCPAQ